MININLKVEHMAYICTFIERKHLQKYLGLRDRLRAAIKDKGGNLAEVLSFAIKPTQIFELVTDLGMESEGNTNKIHGEIDSAFTPQITALVMAAMPNVMAWKAYGESAKSYANYSTSLLTYDAALEHYNSLSAEEKVNVPQPTPPTTVSQPTLPTIPQPTAVDIEVLQLAQMLQDRTAGQVAYRRSMVDAAFVNPE